MNSAKWLGALLALAGVVSSAPAAPFGIGTRHALDKANRTLHGQLVDFTANHGSDNRIWSEALQEKRDLYVYLPPGFDPCKRYPLVIWLHTFRQDETGIFDRTLEPFDRAVACGELPPMIIAVPDGSIKGRPHILRAGSFFMNTNAGCFEDFVMRDVWDFVHTQFPIRPEREAKALVGASMGGFAAYNLGFKYPQRVKNVVGIFPPLNMRWVDCHGKYSGNFDPCCWGWRDKLRGCEVVARYYCVIAVRMKRLIYPLYGRGGDEALANISKENPIEMLETYNIRPGMLDMYIAYGGKDQFNIDAQVESFLWVAKERGICPTVDYLPDGKHDLSTALKFFPNACRWLHEKLAPYAPPCQSE